MRTQSIMPDPAPVPMTAEPPKQEEREPNGFEKLARGGDYKDVQDYLDQRIEFYQTHLPNGDNIVDEKDKAAKIAAWDTATAIIAEFKALQNTLQTYKTHVAK